MKKCVAIWGALCLVAVIFSGQSCSPKLFRLSAGPYTFSISADGALVKVEKGGVVLKAAGPVIAGEVILGDKRFLLARPASMKFTEDRLELSYEPAAEIPLRTNLTYQVSQNRESTVLAREIVLQLSSKFDSDLTVRLPLAPFSLSPDTWLPLKNGVGARLGEGEKAAYKFAGKLRADAVSLAIPMVSLESRDFAARCTIAADPYYSILFEKDAVEWTYPRTVGLENGQETRTVFVILHADSVDQSLSEFYANALNDVPAGPSWLHEIAMVDYDYLSDGGKGWFKDIDALTQAVPAPDRHQILLCLHGWYDFVGRYTFDKKTGKLDPAWTAFSNYPNVKDKFPNSVPVQLTIQKMHERLSYARSRGFRAALYFGDGMSAGDGLLDIFSPQQVLYWGGWQGPDTRGKTYCQNPLSPAVQDFFIRYLGALLQEYGKDLDALVWDETFHVDTGSLGTADFPGYADRAMMRLVKDLTAEVHEFNKKAGTEIAFLASDCIGVFNWVNKPPYALVADGTYQDTHCDPVAWSYGIFPNLRNVLWSCNWDPVSGWDFTEFGVRHYQAAVAISNGWGDDCGFAEMSPEMKQKVMALFNWRKQNRNELRWFETLPVYSSSLPKSSILW